MKGSLNGLGVHTSRALTGDYSFLSVDAAMKTRHYQIQPFTVLDTYSLTVKNLKEKTTLCYEIELWLSPLRNSTRVKEAQNFKNIYFAYRSQSSLLNTQIASD